LPKLNQKSYARNPIRSSNFDHYREYSTCAVEQRLHMKFFFGESELNINPEDDSTILRIGINCEHVGETLQLTVTHLALESPLYSIIDSSRTIPRIESKGSCRTDQRQGSAFQAWRSDLIYPQSGKVVGRKSFVETHYRSVHLRETPF